MTGFCYRVERDDGSWANLDLAEMTATERERVISASGPEMGWKVAFKIMADAEEHNASFDLRWKADMRAIAKWQEATGRKLTWPDHADLCVWLLEQLDERNETTHRTIASLNDALAAMTADRDDWKQHLEKESAGSAVLFDRLCRMERALTLLTIASCTCLTKSPELQYHDEQCPYRIAAEALEPPPTCPCCTMPVTYGQMKEWMIELVVLRRTNRKLMTAALGFTELTTLMQGEYSKTELIAAVKKASTAVSEALLAQ